VGEGRSNKFKESEQQESDKEKLKQKRQEYNKKIKELRVETLLHANIDHDSCFLMQKIKEDVEKYVRENF
jgi:hypothetical protein